MTRVPLIPETPSPDYAPTHVLRCRCGFRMDAPADARPPHTAGELTEPGDVRLAAPGSHTVDF